MLWVLLFAILFSSLSESPYLNRGSQQLVKKHVVDKDRREAALSLIKPAKKKEKKFLKTENKIIKEIFSVSKSRETEAAEFNALFEKYRQASAETRATNLKVVMGLQELITDEEWQNIKPDLKKELQEINAKHGYGSKTINKYFVKLEKIIADEVKQSEQSSIILERLTKFEKQTFGLLDSYSEEIMNENSLLYKFHIEESEMVNIQNEHQDNVQKLFGEYRELYFVIVENTTEEEYKRISKKLKLPF